MRVAEARMTYEHLDAEVIAKACEGASPSVKVAIASVILLDGPEGASPTEVSILSPKVARALIAIGVFGKEEYNDDCIS